MPVLLAPIEPSDLLVGYRDRVIQENTQDCMHYHDVYELILVIQSQSMCFVGDRSYRFQDRSLLLIPPQKLHTIRYQTGTNYVLYVVNFSQSFVQDVLNTVGESELLAELSESECHGVQLSVGRFHQLHGLFHALYNSGQNIHNRSLAKSYLGVILQEAAKDFREAERPALAAHQGVELVQQVIGFIDQHFQEEITLEKLADTFFVSKFHLSRMFSQITGSGVVNYIQCRRILEAQKLLMQGELNNQQISVLCGFESTQHFYRVFKKITGQVPGNFRMPGL